MPMTFAERLREGRFPVSLEITPPQRLLRSVLLRRARLLDGCVRTINVIQRPDRLSSLDASLELLRHGFEPVWHLVTRGREAADIEADVARAAEGGVRNVLCLLGDHQAERSPSRPLRIREAVALVRRLMPEASVGVTLNQYATPVDAVIRNLLPKLGAGATFAQTQPVFDLGRLEALVGRVRREAPEVRVVAMAMPLLSEEAARRVASRLGIELGGGVLERIARGEGWAVFEESLVALRRCGFVDGLAIMTFEMDPPSEMGLRIRAALAAANVACD